MPVTFQVVGNLADFGNDVRAGVKVRATATPGVKVGDVAVHSNEPETVVTDAAGAFTLELVSLPGVWYRIQTPYANAINTVNLAGYVPDALDPTTGTEFPALTVINLRTVMDEDPTPGYDVLAYLDDGALGAEEDARIAADAALDVRVDALEVAPPAHTHPLADVTDAGTAAAADVGDFATAAQGALADAATQPGDLGTAAAADVGDFATAAQGILADSATQPGDLATVATTGVYADLSGRPTLGTAATTAATAYATAAQGTLADTALQPATAQAINAQTGTTYTLVAGDVGKVVTLDNAAAITLNAPGSVFTAGQRVDVVVIGAGMATVVGTSGATANGTPSLVSRAQWSAFTILWTSATACVVIGDMA